jgi:hypothetical protein
VSGTKRLKQTYDKLLSSFAFNFKLRRYMKEGDLPKPEADRKFEYLWNCRAALDPVSRIVIATVGWCNLRKKYRIERDASACIRMPQAVAHPPE